MDPSFSGGLTVLAAEGLTERGLSGTDHGEWCKLWTLLWHFQQSTHPQRKLWLIDIADVLCKHTNTHHTDTHTLRCYDIHTNLWKHTCILMESLGVIFKENRDKAEKRDFFFYVISKLPADTKFSSQQVDHIGKTPNLILGFYWKSASKACVCNRILRAGGNVPRVYLEEGSELLFLLHVTFFF